jgi:hypothetical protein
MCGLRIADVWVRSHMSEMPTTLADFRAYPFDHQRAFYNHMPTQLRIKLWREQLEPELGLPTGLTSLQRELLGVVLDNLPTLVGDSTGRRGREFMAREKLDSRLVEAFGPHRAYVLFTIFRAIGCRGYSEKTRRTTRRRTSFR